MGRILIVEDDSTLREGYGIVLELEGHDVRTACHGQQALKLMSGEWVPDAIFLDLTMPVMNGWEFRNVQRADPRLRHIPVVVLTGAAENIDGLDAFGHLEKPFRMDDMLDALDALAALQRQAPTG